MFARTKDYRFFRFCQLVLIIVLPFLLQWSLGGYFALLLALTVISGFADPLVARHAARIPTRSPMRSSC